jgi:spoIIIJ-associated protein
MATDIASIAKHRLEDLLAFFGANAQVQSEFDGETLKLSVDTEDTGRLIGHRGETLSALQHIMSMSLQGQNHERLYVHIDVGGYKQARAERLVERAREAAEKVAETGEEVVLPPMSPAERRLVHMELREAAGVATESRGEGPRRRLVIVKTS